MGKRNFLVMNVDDRDAPPPRQAWSATDTLMLGSSIHPVLSRQGREPVNTTANKPQPPQETAAVAAAGIGREKTTATATAAKSLPAVQAPQPLSLALQQPPLGLTDWRRRQQHQQEISFPAAAATLVYPQPELQTQRLPQDLDHAVAIGLARPTAPFAKSERKKALQSAIYYSECYLRGIKPVDADTAAFDIQHQYDKWWVDSKHSAAAGGCTDDMVGQAPETVSTTATIPDNDSHAISDDNHTGSPKKRRRLEEPLEAKQTQTQYAGTSRYRYSSSSDEDEVPSRSASPTGSTSAASQLSLPDRNSTLHHHHHYHHAEKIKDRLMNHLRDTGGDTTSPEFFSCLDYLNALYRSRGSDARAPFAHTEDGTSCDPDGTWLTLTKPTFSECLGRNSDGEYMYTLGRMSFDMFRPTHLKCSIRAVMNHVRVMDPKRKPKSFPSRLLKELKRAATSEDGPPTIRHYDIVVAFTIEANQTRRGTTPSSDQNNNGPPGNASSSPSDNGSEFVVPRPIRGLMTNHGYMVADPIVPNRSSIWFSGGSIEVQDEVNDAEVWRNIFDESLAPRRDMRGMATMLAAKLLLGAYTKTSRPTGDDQHEDQDDGVGNTQANAPPTLSYFFKRPIGGHGEVFCDALYADHNLRVLQGHRGSIFVFARVPAFYEDDHHEKECPC